MAGRPILAKPPKMPTGKAILETCPSGEEARPAGRPSGEDNATHD